MQKLNECKQLFIATNLMIRFFWINKLNNRGVLNKIEKMMFISGSGYYRMYSFVLKIADLNIH